MASQLDRRAVLPPRGQVGPLGAAAGEIGRTRSRPPFTRGRRGTSGTRGTISSGVAIRKVREGTVKA
jgi:hypothetical protein